jgi:Reverse transcriptase (RNA-dependent DNA polymerase)
VPEASSAAAVGRAHSRAKGDRGADDHPGEGRERRNADTLLGVIRARGRRRLPLETIERPLDNRHLSLQADGRLYRHEGARPPGATADTVDARALTKSEASIDALRHERDRWPPGRRVYIETPPSTKKRPLGLPTCSAKGRQAVIRRLVAADYDPQCRPHAHGFRPGRGGPTARGEITRGWKGGKWLIEGDLAPGFDSLDHAVLRTLLRERFADQRFVRPIATRLKAGYLAEGRHHTPLSGVPQGGGVRPILGHLDWDRLARFVATVLRPAYNAGPRRSPYPPSMALLNGARNYRLAGNPRAARAWRRQARRLPARHASDPHVRRRWSVRYADDGLLGFRGPREEADTIKGRLQEAWRETRHLPRAPAKTVGTHARTEAARVLGDELVTQHADDQQHRA